MTSPEYTSALFCHSRISELDRYIADLTSKDEPIDPRKQEILDSAIKLRERWLNQASELKIMIP